eukprot:3870150-Pleurochrysis_carterae.AAC.1
MAASPGAETAVDCVRAAAPDAADTAAAGMAAGTAAGKTAAGSRIGLKSHSEMKWRKGNTAVAGCTAIAAGGALADMEQQETGYSGVGVGGGRGIGAWKLPVQIDISSVGVDSEKNARGSCVGGRGLGRFASSSSSLRRSSCSTLLP